MIANLLDVAEIQATDSVIEIGAGLGFITKELLQKGATVQAIEIDKQLCKAALHAMQSPKCFLIENDVLKIPDEHFLRGAKLVGNLPFHITTPILEKILRMDLVSITIIVQKEVADKIFAKEGTKAFGPLALLVQFYAKAEQRFDIAPSCFYPKPKVISSLLHFTLKTAPKIDPFELIYKAFLQRRKQLTNSLSIAKELLPPLGIREDARPEMLSLDQWIALKKIS